MKRFFLVLCAMICVPAFSQKAEGPRYAHWWEWLHGLGISMEGGAHEYPLAVWFPKETGEGYSIRSLYVKPALSYERLFGDVNAGIKMEAVIDLGAPDPRPGAAAPNAKSASRENWYTIKVEENIDWNISNLFGEDIEFPGVLSVYLENENSIYAYPKFPATENRREGKIASGRVEFGPGKFQADTKAGLFLGKIGIPVYYLDRFNDGIASGINATFGYNSKINLGVEITSRTLFTPTVAQYETEIVLTYTWLDLTAKVGAVAYGSFTSAKLNPEVQCKLGAFDLAFGGNVEGLGGITSFSPYIKAKWTY